MPATKFVIKFSSATGRVRSFAYFDDKEETDDNLPGISLLPGEAILLLPNDLRGDLASYQALVIKATGLVPTNDTYAVVDAKGLVVASITADPQCDSIQDHTLVQSPEAKPGWTYNGENFSPALTL